MPRVHFPRLLLHLLDPARFHLRIAIRAAFIHSGAHFIVCGHLHVPPHFFVELRFRPSSPRPIFHRILQPHVRLLSLATVFKLPAPVQSPAKSGSSVPSPSPIASAPLASAGSTAPADHFPTRPMMPSASPAPPCDATPERATPASPETSRA